MAVVVVTDSTAHLPEGFAARHSVRVVPLHVVMDDRTGLDGIDIGPTQLAAALSQRLVVTTSRPSPHEFATAYREELEAGASAVVSVHLSRHLSGTWDSARLAAEEVGADKVRVVDARTTGMGLGFAALRAAAAAVDGAKALDVEAEAVTTAARTKTYFMVETLEYLRRGGRIGAAAALVGTALAVKPVLHVADGRIMPLEKVRTTGRALARLVDLAVDSAGSGPVSIAVHHLAAPERAAELATRLEERLPRSSGCVVSELGAVIGAHTGPGVLGVVVLPD
ncbi:DegV family protein [Kibdelosporangium phytohabitans]|uniref:Fatty acid-binding protein DegV n=1 Tax=Kibdelosporangium phytohabitans TaxID=860235 RepID=A0A0N9HVA2_9PSEU|nr:DegV family protein [Kibdelosporangium phytohabitans]ALG07500.1 fatty acid-binding protein DegV [Kibdelosporangium phytohabitans]MBE1471586.1 DegV family protein with EDD domain [Kibdelosporangium phytohabitans]